MSESNAGDMVVGLTASWLDNSTSPQDWGKSVPTKTDIDDWGVNTIYIPNYPTYYHWCNCGTPRPIKLKMSQVEYLRRLAKEDARLKNILKKFTDQIEIAVDFD